MAFALLCHQIQFHGSKGAGKQGLADDMKITQKLKLLTISMMMNFLPVSKAEALESREQIMPVMMIQHNTGYQPDDKSISTAAWTNNERSRLLIFEVLTGSLLFLLIIGGMLYCGQYRRSSRIAAGLEKNLNERSFCLEQVTEEKDWLMKEIHHRVKNTLQIIMSLLNTQLSYLTDMEAIQAIQNSQHRMFAISLIHQKLYQAESLSAIDMESYIPELMAYLKDAFDADGRIGYQLELIPLSLDVSRALPLGLILNEAISNALKFAFPTEGGEIRLQLKSPDEQHYEFTIADNGIGLSADYNNSSVDSFGQTLIAGLTRQLGGTYRLENNDGVSVHITFKKDE